MSSNKKALLCCAILLLGNTACIVLADTDNPPFERYALPRDKRVLEICKQSALTELPGKIESFRIHNTGGEFFYRFRIKGPDDVLWIVVCEGSTQTVTRVQRYE